ncbi:unnamed protein product, partial [Closterium sp. NIES-65]
HHQQVRQQLQETRAQQHEAVEAARQQHAVGEAHVSATATTPNTTSTRLGPPQGPPTPPPSPPASAAAPIKRDQLLVWESLGTSEIEQIRACQVAVARALYTAVKENCLAGPTGGASNGSSSSSMGSGGLFLSSSPAKSLSLASRNRLVAFLCTLFGGPVADHPLCNFTEPSSGRQLKDQAELLEYIRATHRTPSRRFSAAQQSLFIQILIMALQSVVQKMPDDAVQAATRLLHAYDDAVVSFDASSCPQADFTVLWDSTSFARRAIADGQRVTWVWNDDNYHELRGPVSSEPFLGFGAGRLGLSRLATCAWDNIGPRDAMDEPAPCVLRSPGDKAGAHFTYTKVFGTAQDMTVKDSPQLLASTLLRATPHPAEPPPATSLRPYEQLLATRCAPACALAMLANGRCDPACNVATCDFDGGDCACATASAAGAGSSSGSAGADIVILHPPLFFPRCPPLLPPPVLCATHRGDLACCEAAGVGEGIKVPFRLRRFGSTVHPLDATPATNASLLPRTVSQYNRCRTVSQYNRCHTVSQYNRCRTVSQYNRCRTVSQYNRCRTVSQYNRCRTVSQYNRCRTVSQYSRCFHCVMLPLRISSLCLLPTQLLPSMSGLTTVLRAPLTHSAMRCVPLCMYRAWLACVASRSVLVGLVIVQYRWNSDRSHVHQSSPASCRFSSPLHLLNQAPLTQLVYIPTFTIPLIPPLSSAAPPCLTRRGRFHFQDACVGGESSRAFGVNPVFLPSSSLYNPNVAVSNTTAFTNQPFANPFELNAKGLPFGFQQLVSPTSPSPMRTTSPSSPDPFLPLPGSGRFPIVFDVNLDNAGATRRLQYLVDGFFIDNYTRTIHVGLITRNANEHLFTATKATLTVQSGGSMEASFQVQPVNVEYYNMNESSNVLRLVVELLFVAAVAWSIVEEVKEMLWTWKVQRRSFWHYTSKGWNWVDWLSIALQITAIAIWISVAVTRAQGFTIQPHYDIYYTLGDNPRYWSLPNPPVGYQAAMSAVDTLGFVTNLCAVYFALQGIKTLLSVARITARAQKASPPPHVSYRWSCLPCLAPWCMPPSDPTSVFIMVLRLLKLMDFQPNMGIMTRSLRVAMPSLLHFFILFFVVFVAYATYGYLVFGMTLVQFSTLWLSLQTCFYMIVGQFGVFWFQQMVGWQYAAAMVFWFSFVIIFCFILFNFLIAIIVDAFMAVKESTEKAPAIYQDMYLIVVRFVRRVASPYTRYSRLLRHLIRLGAENTANAVMEVSGPAREKSLRQSRQQCFASSLQCGKETRGSRRDTDGGRLEDAVRDGNPGMNGVEVVGREGKMDPFEAQQQVSAMVGADETNLSRAESKKGVLPNGGVAKSLAAGSTNTQVDAHASTTPAANPGSTAAGDAGSTGGSMVEPAVQRRRSFWRLKTLDERETVVVVGERQLNAHSLSSILRRAHARMTPCLSLPCLSDSLPFSPMPLRLLAFLSHAMPSHPPLQRLSLSDEQEGDPMDVAALGAVLLSELGESAPPADATAANGGEAAKEGDLLAMQQHVEALRADVARGFDQVRQQLTTQVQSSHCNQLPQEASPSLLPNPLGNGSEEAGQEVWQQVLMQVEKIRKEAQKEREEGMEILQELRRELQMLRAAREGRERGGEEEKRDGSGGGA